MPSLLDLAPLQLHFIASCLDGRDAKSLARSCSALQDAGESRVWAKLDLQTDGDYCVNLNIKRQTEGLLVREPFLHYFNQGDDKLQAMLAYLASLLVKRPQRCGFVRSIHVECARISPFSDARFFPWQAEMLAILQAPDDESRRLHEAANEPLADGAVESEEARHYRIEAREDEENDRQYLRRIFRDKPNISQPIIVNTFEDFPVLPAVRDLHITLCEPTWRDFTSAWSRITPNVVSLYVTSHHYRQYPSFQRLVNNVNAPWSPWTSVTDLIFLNMHNHVAEFAIGVLESCPNMSEFDISQCPWNYNSPEKSKARWQLARCLASHPGLTSVNVPEPYRGMMLTVWRSEGDEGTARVDRAIKSWEADDEVYRIMYGGDGSDSDPDLGNQTPDPKAIFGKTRYAISSA